MSNSDYNKIISTINSVSRDYTYSPDPNNLICIDTSNNRIGINTLYPQESLHISGGDIKVYSIYADSVFSGGYSSQQSGSISVTNVNAINVNSDIVNVSNTLDISNGRIKANYIDISSILDISRGNILVNKISTNTIDISSTLDISRGNIISNKISSVTIDISSTLDISRGHIISNKISTFTIDISDTLDISQGRITTKTIDVSSISVSSLLDISRGRIKAQTIDASAINVTSLLDISQVHIEAQTIDASVINVSSLLDSSQCHIIAQTIDASAINVSLLLDSSQGRIKAQTIDASAINVSSLLDISQGRIKAQTIDISVINVSSLLDSSQGHIEANTIDASVINVTSLLDISQGRIKAQTLDASAITVSSLLDISRGTILANTISGSAITINTNAVSSDNIVNININNTNITGINISTTNLTSNAITINNVRVATIQHIKNAIPYGLIVAYNSITNIPYGWALCNGEGNPPRPDLRGRFILGYGHGTDLTNRVLNASGGEERVTLIDTQLPTHSHKYSYLSWLIRTGNLQQSDGGTGYLSVNTTTPGNTGYTGGSGGVTVSHNNMPPFYVLVYIMKTNDYDFCYNRGILNPIASIITTNPNIILGQSTTLTPLFSNATTVTIDGSNSTPSGGAIISNVAFSVTPTVDKTYILLVTNSLNVQASASVTIYVAALTIPSAPTNLTGYYNGSYGSLYQWYISWNAPLSNGNTDIIAYDIYEVGISYRDTVGPSILEYTYSTNEYADARTFEVRAKNSGGSSINNLVITLSYLHS